MFTIRRAENRDIPDIMRLLRQVNMVHHLGRPDLFRGPTTKYTEQELGEILADDERPVFVLTDDGDRVLGHAFCLVERPKNPRLLTDITTLYIDDICVDEQARGQHVGRRLYAHVRDYARALGCYNVTLNVWCCNEGAMRFYEKCGLKPQKIGMEEILQAGTKE